MFPRASQLIPTNAPAMNDPKFTKDRAELSGRPWSKEAVEKNRPEALVAMRAAFAFLESLLEDGRKWIGKTDEPGLADIEGMFFLGYFVYSTHIRNGVAIVWLLIQMLFSLPILINPFWALLCFLLLLSFYFSNIIPQKLGQITDNTCNRRMAVPLVNDHEGGTSPLVHLSGAVPQDLHVDRALWPERQGRREERRQAEDDQWEGGRGHH